MLRGRAEIGAVVVLIVALFAPTSARAAGAATTTDAPLPTALNGVACTSDTDCIGVGERVVGNYDRTLVKRWNGASWAVVATPNPPGKVNVELSDVSCTSTTYCIAVGGYSTKYWSRTLVEYWNGAKWSIMASPNPPGQTFASLDDVSCTAGAGCIAVGGYATKAWSRTLVERLHGARWSIMSSPNPPGQTFASLGGVDCTTATTCVAVGSYATKAWARTLAERWSGGGWVIVASPNPAGQNFSGLDEVDCPTATSCYAVGEVNARTLAEHFDGVHWTAQVTPNPSGPRDVLVLGSVACTADTECRSVGGYINTKQLVVASITQHWNGSKWSSVAPAPSSFSLLVGVSCVSATSCYGVGAQLSGALQEHWDGAHWAVQS